MFSVLILRMGSSLISKTDTAKTENILELGWKLRLRMYDDGVITERSLAGGPVRPTLVYCTKVPAGDEFVTTTISQPADLNE